MVPGLEFDDLIPRSLPLRGFLRGKRFTLQSTILRVRLEHKLEWEQR